MIEITNLKKLFYILTIVMMLYSVIRYDATDYKYSIMVFFSLIPMSYGLTLK
jgi:hypothetical protein